MCGISGILSQKQGFIPQNLKDKLISSLNHRGPDENGYWQNSQVLLTHNRLTIIDLDGGQQPMVSPSKNTILSYNGEIYNFPQLKLELTSLGHQFQSESDTEVLLHCYEEWGPQCLERLQGMFAFAVWDELRKQLFVARDRAGIKPLYYYHCDDFFIFSSELNSLLQFDQVPRDLDYNALDHYLHYQYTPRNLTMYRGIFKLLPAHSITCDLKGKVKLEKYWDLEFKPDHSKSESQWLSELDDVLNKSISAHLHSDVPFGSFLSGGIDSSVVSFLMAKHLPTPVETFTIGFDENTYDERAYAEQAANLIGANYNYQVIHPNHFDFLGDFLTRMVTHYGEPFADSSAIPTFYVSELARSKVKMILSGDGGDELFAGYNTYPNILTGSGEAPSLIHRALNKLGLAAPQNDILRNAYSKPNDKLVDLHSIYYAYFRDDARQDMYTAATASRIGDQQPQLMREIFNQVKSPNNLSSLQYLDFNSYLPGDILNKVDIASMMHSLEVRVPLLDHTVVEFAATVPAQYKMRGLADGSVEKKYLLKKYAHQLYPDDFFDRPKQGFGVPIDHWLSGPCYEQVCSLLLENASLMRIINKQSLVNLVDKPEKVKNNAGKVWALLFLSRWLDIFRPNL